MHLRPWINERHQTPKSDFLDFRFAASICTLSGLGLSKDIERAPAANLKCALLSSRIQAQSRLRDLVQNVMAITDARSRFWLRNTVPPAIRRRNSMNASHGSVDAWTELFDIVQGTTACSSTRLGEPSHRQSFKRAHADKVHRVDAMTSSALPDPVALRPTWKGNLIFLLVVAVVVLAVAS